MRFLFLLMLLVGAAIGIGYPFLIQNFSGHEIGIWRIYDRASGFRPVEATLDPADAPVRVLVDMTSLGSPRLSGGHTVLTITAATAGRTVLAETLDFVNATPHPGSPQSGEKLFRDDAGVISKVEGGAYSFTVGPGDAEGIEMKSVDLVLRAGAAANDQRAQPVGFTLMAVGFIGFVLASRRGAGGRPQPPAPRWGRAGGERP